MDLSVNLAAEKPKYNNVIHPSLADMEARAAEKIKFEVPKMPNKLEQDQYVKKANEILEEVAGRETVEKVVKQTAENEVKSGFKGKVKGLASKAGNFVKGHKVATALVGAGLAAVTAFGIIKAKASQQAEPEAKQYA